MNQFYKYIRYGVFCWIAASSCTSKEEVTEEPIAQVGNAVLYVNDIADRIPKHMSVEDSILYSKRIVREWINRQLLVEEAENQLSPNEKELSKEIESYKNDLLIHRLKAKYFDEDFTATVHDDQIEEYYSSNIQNFVLQRTIVKVKYYIFPEEVELETLYDLYQSKDSTDQKQLQDFTYKNAKRYDDFNDSWLSIDDLLLNIGVTFSQLTPQEKKNNIIEQVIRGDRHVIVISEMIESGKVSPIEYVRSDIVNILTGKKKLDFLTKIQDSLYNNALKYNKFRLFKN